MVRKPKRRTSQCFPLWCGFGYFIGWWIAEALQNRHPENHWEPALIGVGIAMAVIYTIRGLFAQE